MAGQTSGRQAQSGSMDLEEMQGKAIEGLQQARGSIESFAKEHPRAAVGIAVGVGFILGGGLTPRLLFGLGAIAARNLVKDYARGQMGALGRGIIGSGESNGGGQKKSGTTSPARTAG